MSLRLASYVCWLGTLLSFAVYNFFVQYEGLQRSPCDINQAEIIFRSTVYCGSVQDERLWSLNGIVGRAFLVGAVCLTVVSGVVKKWRMRD